MLIECCILSKFGDFSLIAPIVCNSKEANSKFKMCISFENFKFFLISLILVDVVGRLLLIGASRCFVSPNVCPNENINFYLYTSANPTTPIEMNISNPETIEKAMFLQAPIKFIIHGYTGHKDGFVNTELRSAYFQRPTDVNIISIDYGALVRRGCYLHAIQNTNVVANCTAQFLERLLRIRRDLQLSQIHFIAFSMGAHVAGLMSSYFGIGQIERISALDAAFPGYIMSARSLKQGDAKFIDGIHTNAGVRGKPLPYADVDFYANGGTFQTHCSMFDSSCSHTFSIVLFAESINSLNGFWGLSCSPYTYSFGYCASSDHQLFGEYVDHEARGTYFFRTADSPPYALEKKDGIF